MANNNKKILPNVPTLRFPEFTEEWKATMIGEVCSEFKSGKGIKADNISEIGNYPVYGGNGLRGFTSKYNHNGLYVLIGRQGALCGNINVAIGKMYITEHAVAVSANADNNTRFLQYLFLKMNLGQYSDQSAQPGLAVNKLIRLKANVPSLSEQDKIASLFSLLDERIATQNKIIDRLESLIKGLCLNLQLIGLKNNTWQKVYLTEVLTERKEKNKDNYEVHSVSVSHGIVNQIGYLGRSFAAKDTSNYHVVKNGDIVYTKSPTGEFPYGIVKQSMIIEDVAVSPLYGVYMPENKDIGTILHYYFMNCNNTNNYLHPLIQKGAKNTINITNQHFLDNAVILPNNTEEIKNVASLLSSIQYKIATNNKLLNSYKKQKQYLLQYMFI